MSAGSITGSRKRSCGKNTRPTRTVDAASVRSAAGRVPEAVRASPYDGRREEQEQRHRRRPEIARRVQPVRGPERHEGVPELSGLEPEPPHGIGGDEAPRLAVVERLERLLGQPGVPGAELGVAQLEVRVGGEIAVADRLAVVADPEVDAAGRRRSGRTADGRWRCARSTARSRRAPATVNRTARRSPVRRSGARQSSSSAASGRKNSCPGRVSAPMPAASPAATSARVVPPRASRAAGGPSVTAPSQAAHPSARTEASCSLKA